MSRILRPSPRRGLRPLRERPDDDNVENSDPDADPDVRVTQMKKNMFEQTPTVKLPVPLHYHQPLVPRNSVVQNRWGKDASSMMNRLEKSFLGGVTEDDEKQVSPSLRQLRMTPGMNKHSANCNPRSSRRSTVIVPSQRATVIATHYVFP